MGQGNKPLYRVTMSRKDGKETDYTDYKGEEKCGKHVPIGAIFAGHFDDQLTLSINKRVTLDPDKYWFNIYRYKERGSDDEDRGARRPRGGRARKPQQEADNDDELEF